MKYAIIKVVNGSYTIQAEGFTDIVEAKVQYHGICQTLWNTTDVIKAVVEIVDENMDCVNGCREFIHHSEESEEV